MPHQPAFGRDSHPAAFGQPDIALIAMPAQPFLRLIVPA